MDQLALIVLLLINVPVLLLIAVFVLDADTNAIVSGSFKARSELPKPPTGGSTVSLFATFVLVLSKYLGFSPKLRQNPNFSFTLPYAEVKAPITISERDVEKYYKAVLGPKQQKEAQATAEIDVNPLFLLTALTTPLLLQLLCKRASPVLPLGAVNVRNQFDFVDPVVCRNLRKFQRAHPLSVVARMGGNELPGKRVKRGMQFDMVIEVSASSKLIFRQTFTTLQMIKLKGPWPAEAAAETAKKRSFVRAKSDLAIDASAPTRYAAVSKDYNPIHMSNLAAKLFGFSRKIVHGNLTAAIVMHQVTQEGVELSGAQGGLRKLWNGTEGPSTLLVEFKRPIPVPAKLQIKWASDGAQVITVKNGDEKVLVDIQAGTA